LKQAKKWLILSHAFNMDGRAASLTVTDKIPHLLRHGITPIVVSSVAGDKDSRFEHFQLLPWGPSGLRFDFRHWFAKKYQRKGLYKVVTGLVGLLLLPFIALERLVIGLSSHSSWSLPAFIKGYFLFRQGKIDLIYSTGGAWSAHLAGWMLKKTTGLPWIVEIHDPMVIRTDPSDDGFKPRSNRDRRFLQKLERLICKDADHIWWFTEGAIAYAKLRNPSLGSKGFVLMPGAEPPLVTGEHAYTNQLHLVHFGSLANDRSLAPIISALHELLQTEPALRDRVVIDVYGAPLDEASVRAMSDLTMQNYVKVWGRLEADEMTGLSGRGRVMKKMHEADILLLLHGDYEWCAEYIPSKWYDYLWSGRPIFAITNRNPSFDDLLIARNSYMAKTLDHASIVRCLKDICNDWESKNLKQAMGSPIGVNEAVAKILGEVYK
jgi:hypothetical protein